MDKKTVGQTSVELLQKEPETRSPIDIQREVHKEWDKELFECIDRGKKDISGDFFVVVITKKEKLMPNVLRNYFGFRRSCPTPDWDQTVFHYHAEGDRIEFLWVVPSRDTCELFEQNVLQIADAEKELLRYVLDFKDGTLMRKTKQLNKEYIG